MPKPIDDDTRELAVSELDRNIVVTAGAGTGKTTLLVNRILHVLLGHKRFQKEESPILSIVAMTFTEKAASDIKIRLMGELEKIVAFINGKAAEDEKRKAEKFLEDIRDSYETTHREIERRARKSLEDMDKAQVGTIHSFAAHILHLYPVESGVAPGFTVDTGDFFDGLFDKEWTRWLDGELAITAQNANLWKDLLRRLDLESLKEFAKRLSGFTIPLDVLTLKTDNKLVIRSLTEALHKKILETIPLCEKPGNNLVLQLKELSGTFESIEKHGISYLNNSGFDFNKKPSTAKTGWTEEGFAAAKKLVEECNALLKELKTVDDAFIATAHKLILPFAKAFRQTYLSQGYVSFDGLLTLTRDLLQNKEYRYIREKLKKDFRTLLVDEFQDTDPIQYDIVLFLSELPGHYSRDARSVILEPGKLFIVGDPKQSIYAFRRADIEAYEDVVKQVCGQDETLKLQENFRSHSGILEVVNQLFDGRIMVELHGLQPRYIPIHANRQKSRGFQKVEIVLVVDRDGEELKADDAREAEAEWIARWITKHVNEEVIEDKLAENGIRKLKYKDVALLLRTVTQVRPYIEALKRYGIPYIVEGEKYFYATQEIVDFMNLLRIIENPHDTIALVGVLRSPMVGLTDREIYELHTNHLLDYRKDILGKDSMSQEITTRHKNTTPEPPPCKEGEGGVKALSGDYIKIIEPFYDFLKRIHARAGVIPVSQLIAEIMDSTHIAEITVCAWHGEQKLANLWKLRQMVCDMEHSGSISLKTFIDHIKTRIKEVREEGESPLSDETLDVVKIMTIHKSKGLEFPVVILCNLHGEEKKNRDTFDSVVYDWPTSTTGIVLGTGDQRVRNLHGVIIERKLKERLREEKKRILYVAMTRAKERLILTGSFEDDDKSYMGLITRSVRDAAGVELGAETFMDLSHTEEDTNLPPSPHPSRQGRGSNEESTSRAENKTYEEDKSSGENFPLPLRKRVGVRGVSQGKFSLGNAEVFVERFKFDGTHRPQKTLKTKALDLDWTALIEAWEKREASAADAMRKSIFISATEGGLRKISDASSPVYPPYKGGKREDILKSREIKTDTEQFHPSLAVLIGSICHRVLEAWDFHGASCELQRSIELAGKWVINLERTAGESLLSEESDKGMFVQSNEISLNSLQIQDVELVKTEVFKILSGFFDSEAYKELQDAEILGREIPFLLDWHGQIMRGSLDILYKTGDRVIIADYKTDHAKTDEFPAKAAQYGYQRDIYLEAVKRCLQINSPEFKIIFLRAGESLAI